MEKNDGSYAWYWPDWSIGGKESATSDVFAARSYLIEIDNTNGTLNESKSTGGIFRRILTTNEFNPQSLFPCFLIREQLISGGYDRAVTMMALIVNLNHKQHGGLLLPVRRQNQLILAIPIGMAAIK